MSIVLEEKRGHLLKLISDYGSCAVAFSGGVDSSVVAKAAQDTLGVSAVAVTAVSASLASAELKSAREIADQIGIRHVEISTSELSNPAYTANAPDRCYHCKTELYSVLLNRLSSLEVNVIVNGANADDLGDFRPGHRAAEEHGVVSPLAECGISKTEVRQLARDWKLPVAEKPAAPCLSSRIAYGQAVTAERLRMIEAAETILRGLGLEEVRVRYHADELARLEVPAAAIGRVAEPKIRSHLAQSFRELGFNYVTLDLEGFRSGSLNDLVPIESLSHFS